MKPSRKPSQMMPQIREEPLSDSRIQSQQIIQNKTRLHENVEYKEHSTKPLQQHNKRNIDLGMDFFKNYQPQSNFNIETLKNSRLLKLNNQKDKTYFGQYVNGVKHGQGIMIYASGRIYQGNWQCDLKHGKGYQKFSNGSKYNGNFINGKPDGYGTFVWHNGEIYQGQWINGLKHGSGMWKGERGDSYIGQWKFGKADGYGVHTWINGDRYEGQFKQCLKHGQGREKFGNGDTYTGNYINGKPSGYGQYTWTNGSFFKGNFKNGLRHGNGIWKKNQGESDHYQGQYINDKKCGYGIFTWKNGNIYKGQFFNDLRNGYGQMYWNDGSIYKGQWKRGIQHGQGQIIFKGEKPKRGIFQQNVLVKILQNKEVQQWNAVNSRTLQFKYDNNKVYSQMNENIQSYNSEYNKKLKSQQNHNKGNSLVTINQHEKNYIYKPIYNIRSRKFQLKQQLKKSARMINQPVRSIKKQQSPYQKREIRQRSQSNKGSFDILKKSHFSSNLATMPASPKRINKTSYLYQKKKPQETTTMHIISHRNNKNRMKQKFNNENIADNLSTSTRKKTNYNSVQRSRQHFRTTIK